MFTGLQCPQMRIPEFNSTSASSDCGCPSADCPVVHKLPSSSLPVDDSSCWAPATDVMADRIWGSLPCCPLQKLAPLFPI